MSLLRQPKVGCCTACGGTGTGNDPQTNGLCWDCKATGCAHPPPRCHDPLNAPRWLDLWLYAAMMLIGLFLVLFSIFLVHLVAAISLGVMGFAVMIGAVRYGGLAKRYHDGG